MSIVNLLFLLLKVVCNPRKIISKIWNPNMETCSVTPYYKNEDNSGM